MNFDKKKTGFQLFGLGKQEFIKYFFGGNASLAIFILALICLFLLKEAWMFLPSHHKQRQSYRKAGVEVYKILDRDYNRYKQHTGALNRAYNAEYSHPNKENQKRLSAYEMTRIYVQREIGHPLLVLRDAIKQRKSETDGSYRAERLDAVIASLKAKIEGRKDELRKSIYTFNLLGFIPIKSVQVEELKAVNKGDRDEIVEAVLNLDIWNKDEAEYYENLVDQSYDVEDQAIEDLEPIEGIFNKFKNQLPKEIDSIWKSAFEHSIAVRDRADSNELAPKQVEGQMNVALASSEISVRKLKYSNVMKAIIEAEYFDEYARAFYLVRLKQLINGLEPDAYESVPSEIRNKASEVLEREENSLLVYYLVSEKNKIDAFPKAVPANMIPDDQRRLLKDLADLDYKNDEFVRRITDEASKFVNPFPFDEEAKTIYALIERFHVAVDDFKVKGEAELEKLPAPDSLTTQLARDEYDDFKDYFKSDVKRFEAMSKRLKKWRHDRPWGASETVSSFFLGKDWTNNSRVQDSYGILPMFCGSLIISIIALVVAVPLSVAGAVYANQIASFREQSFIKPAIEFIGAIPSVVLGFLGIMVVGPLLKDFSNLPLINLLPGFPIDARLNMLLAGLLLGFMAVPIIFTLAEDALNNVPQAFRDGSLSLGATRLQTAFRVILPASLSGVIAAVLLGFGRVIGETMVVLLVAGNRMAIPGFSKGIGVVTEPAHTLTGNIAQGLGEAAEGSVDYRALFMVGLVLFVITLMINFIGQRILTKYQPA